MYFGKRLSVYSAPITLQVYGWRALQEPAELAPNLRREETFELDCCLSSFAGDQDYESREAECIANWNLLYVAVGNDATLGGIVRWAQFTEYEFSADSNPTGGQSIGHLEFKIQCVQRVESLS